MGEMMSAATAKFWAIRSKSTEVENPISTERLASLSDFAEPVSDMAVLDVGCGKAWLLRQWAKTYGIRGTGLELNPHYVEAARDLTREMGIADRITYIEGPALDFDFASGSFDIVMCLGATSALGGTAPAISWMRNALSAQGVMILGVAYRSGTSRSEFATALPSFDEILSQLKGCGLSVIGVLESSLSEWDAFRSQQFKDGHDWLLQNRDHSDWNAMQRKLSEARDRYFNWQRSEMKWGIVVARPIIS